MKIRRVVLAAENPSPEPLIPTLNTLLAVLKSVGMRLSVEPEDKSHA